MALAAFHQRLARVGNTKRRFPTHTIIPYTLLTTLDHRHPACMYFHATHKIRRRRRPLAGLGWAARLDRQEPGHHRKVIIVGPGISIQRICLVASLTGEGGQFILHHSTESAESAKSAESAESAESTAHHDRLGARCVILARWYMEI